MYSAGDKIIYGEHGVCTIEKIAPLDMHGSDREKLYYYLTPYVGTGMFFAPVEGGPFTRPLISREEADALIASIPDIAPAICNDNRFNHVDAFYKELFRLHSCEALVAVIKGLRLRMAERKTKSSRAEITMKRAKDILHGELSVVLGIDIKDVEGYILEQIGK